MRRLWAFILMVLTLFLGVTFLSQPIIENSNISNEFENGSQAVYKISIDEDSSTTSNSDLKNDFDVKEQFQTRLEAANIRGASIDIIWPENQVDRVTEAEVKVTFSRKSSSELGLIRRVIEGNGDLTITTKNTSADEIMTGTDFFESSTPASIKYDDNNSPYIALKLKDSSVWTTMSDKAAAQEDSDEQKKLYIWRNFISEGKNADSWDKAFSTDEDVKDVISANKVLFILNTEDCYDSDNQEIKITTDYSWDVDSARSPWASSGTETAWTISTARAMVESLNATNYGYNVTYLYNSSFVEPVFGSQGIIYAIAGISVALGLLFILMIIKYGLAGVVSLVSNVVTIFLTIFISAFLGFEFSIASICALGVIGVLGAFINATYFDHVLSEFKKGRTVDKANKEGYKKAFNVVIDACALSFFTALFSFLIAKGLVKVLFGYVIIGSVLCFLLSNYLTKWMMYWLTTYAKNASPKLVFGYHVSKKDVFYDANAELSNVSDSNETEENEKIIKSSKKKLKIHSSLISAFSLAAVILLAVFGGIYGGQKMFNVSGDFSSSYVLSIMTTSDYYNDQNNGNVAVQIKNNDILVGYIKNVVIQNSLSSYTPLNREEKFTSVDEFMSTLNITFDNYTFNFVTIENDSESTDKEFNVIYADYKMPILTGEAKEARDDAIEKVIIPGIVGTNESLYTQSAAKSNIAKAENFKNETLKELYEPYAKISDCESGIVEYTLTWMSVVISLIGVFAFIYITLRYGIAAGLTEFILVTFAVLMGVVGLLITRVPFSSIAGCGIMAGALIASFLMLPYLSKNKDILKEVNLYRNAKFVVRQKSSKVAFLSSGWSIVVGLSGSLLVSCLATSFIGLNTLSVGLGMGIVTLATGLLMFLYVPYLFPFFRDHMSLSFITNRFTNTKDNISKKRKNRKVIVADPNEAKETVIPGINDYRNF